VERRRREEGRVQTLGARQPAAVRKVGRRRGAAGLTEARWQPPTEPKPFELESVERHERARRELELKVERERWDEEQARKVSGGGALRAPGV
jgi:hypothetical protein